MKPIFRFSSLFVFLSLFACVTINVYFPAAAAESAADRLIKEVYGIEDEAAPEAEPTPEDVESSFVPAPHYQNYSLLEFLIPSAHAQQPDINISTPAINRLKSQMTQRHQQLVPFYTAGAVGMDSNGFIRIKDIKATDLKNRNLVKKLLNDENRDRSALYKEIAKANNHPEWESEIQATFARRWIANAPGGWWYSEGGSWRQK